VKVSLLGCGWVGLPLGRELLRRGHEVRGSTTSPEKLTALRRAGIRPYLLNLAPEPEGEVGDFFEADALVLTLPPKRREKDVRSRYPAQLEAALRAAPEGARVVFTSSTSVYPELNRVVTEADAGGDVGASGDALLEAETRLRTRGATILRLAGLYGYDRQPGRALAGKEVTGGDARVNLVHRDDVVAVLACVLEGNVANETLNVCADQHPTRREVYTRGAARFGFKPPRFVAPHQKDFKIVSSRALKEKLGYRFLFPDPLEPAP